MTMLLIGSVKKDLNGYEDPIMSKGTLLLFLKQDLSNPTTECISDPIEMDQFLTLTVRTKIFCTHLSSKGIDTVSRIFLYRFLKKNLYEWCKHDTLLSSGSNLSSCLSV